jgi:hypothetical protein
MYKKFGEKTANQYSIAGINKFCKSDNNRHHKQHINWPGEQFQNSVTTTVINNEGKIKVGPIELH